MEKRGKGKTEEHYNAILMEEIRSQMQLVVEGMYTTETRLSREMSEMRKELKGEILLTQQAVKALKQDMNTIEAKLTREMSKMRTELKGDILLTQQTIQGVRTELKQDMSTMEDRLTRRIDAHNEKLVDHENRISVLENGRV